MTCCAPAAEAAAERIAPAELDDETLMAVSRPLADGTRQIELAVPDVHCAACMAAIEGALASLPMVETARINLSARRVRVSFTPGTGRPSDIVRAVHGAGYRAFLPDLDGEGGGDRALTELTRALAVSGFAAGNIMLFSVSIWSGAEPVTRDLFHWISALIALPAIAYAGQVFFRSAWAALRQGRTNMDVPISLAILLAPAMSLWETFNSGPHAYFDAAVSLLFFLLIGRTLDHLMRDRARGAVRNLARMAPRGAMRVHADGRLEHVAVSEIVPGMLLDLAAGERVPVDAEVVGGTSAVDLSLVTGESLPEPVGAGATLLAGATNLSAPLRIRAMRPATDSFLARMIALMEAAEGSKAGYRRIADRAAALYAPVVHVLALGTLLYWGVIVGDWHMAMTNAIAVLIITCPCALALAVPIVHVVAAGRLFEQGILMRDGAALERMAEVDRVAFDKTGTLTLGRPRLEGQSFGDPGLLAIAGSLGAMSRHPFSRALAEASGARPAEGAVREEAGQGVEALIDGTLWRLGRPEWCGGADGGEEAASTVWLSRDGEAVAAFRFSDTPRPEAGSVIDELRQAGVELSLLSGDRTGPVAALAGRLGIADARARMTPADKLAVLEARAARGERVLMVGDGINDAPALRAAHVSMAPSSASDVGRNAADFVFTRDRLDAVPFTLGLARRAGALVRQNFALAIGYNFIAVPLAVTGHVTPLVAALAMSSSSVLVTLNALRLRLDGRRREALEARRVAQMAAAE